MNYVQLSLLAGGPATTRERATLVSRVLSCPGCGQYVSCPVNSNMYSVVCLCGYFTLPRDDRAIYWYPPAMAIEAIEARLPAPDSKT